MYVNTPDSWSAHRLSKHGEMLSGPAAFLLFRGSNMRLTTYSSTVKGGRDEEGVKEEGEVVFSLSNRL